MKVDHHSPLDLSAGRQATVASDEPLDLSQSSKANKQNHDLVSQGPPHASTHMLNNASASNSPPTYSKSPVPSVEQYPPAANPSGRRCSQCFYVANDLFELQHHYLSTHKQSQSDQLAYKPPALRRVPIGFQSPFLSKESHIPKLTSSSNSPRHHCTHCGWQCNINSTSYFSRHMEQHTRHTGSTYKCTYCSQKFHEPNALKTHLFCHQDVFNYICSFCSKAYPTDLLLAEHMELHTDQNIQKSSAEKSVPTFGKLDVASTSRECTSTESWKSSENNKLKPVSGPATPKSISGFGSSLAKHIEKAITKEYANSSKPRPTTIGELMFMVSESDSPSRGSESPQGRHPLNVESNGMSLLSLLGKVVEDGLSLDKSEETTADKAAKQNMTFVVTFSDEDDEGFSSLSSEADYKEATVEKRRKGLKRKQSDSTEVQSRSKTIKETDADMTSTSGATGEAK